MAVVLGIVLSRELNVQISIGNYVEMVGFVCQFTMAELLKIVFEIV